MVIHLLQPRLRHLPCDQSTTWPFHLQPQHKRLTKLPRQILLRFLKRGGCRWSWLVAIWAQYFVRM